MADANTPPRVMKPLIKPRQKVMMGFHFFMNLVFYGYFVYFFVNAFMQAEASQMVWMSLFSVVLFSDIVFHLWSITINHKMSVVDTSVSVSGLRVAMIVTKAPSEPWSVVKKTLEAMLNQNIDSAYDVWLADEKPHEDTVMWCAEQGVFISSREGVDGYHNIDWPLRRKCKEGNLMYFYDKVGYDKYDVFFNLTATTPPLTIT